MVFDLKDKKNKPIIDYVSNKCGGVVASTTMNRANFKKILSNLGLPNQKIQLFATHGEALEALKAEKINILLSDYRIGNSDAVELLKKHREVMPNRLNAIFMVIAENNSPAMVCKIADEEAESLVIKPYTMDTLEKELLRVLDERVSPNRYQTLIEEVKETIKANQTGKALEMLDQAIAVAATLKIKASRAHYLKGMIYLDKIEYDSAGSSLQNALMSDQKHYKTLIALIDMHVRQRKFKEAYDAIEVMIKFYPPNPERIPDIMKVCIANEKFDALLQICDVFVNLDEKIPSIEQPIAAGLALGSKYLIEKGQIKKAILILDKAAEFGRSNSKIMSSVLKSMISVGEIDRAERIIDSITSKDAPKEIKLLELIVKESSRPVLEVLKFGNDLLKQGIKEYDVFTAVIRCSVAAGRKKNTIEDTVNEAANMYPERKEALYKLIEKAPE